MKKRFSRAFMSLNIHDDVCMYLANKDTLGRDTLGKYIVRVAECLSQAINNVICFWFFRIWNM